MEKIFLNLLEMSVISSYVILAVLLTRVFLQKSPKIFSYLLWSVVFFRLLCPVTLESPVSILPQATKEIDFSRFGDFPPVEQEKTAENVTISPESPSSPQMDVSTTEFIETAVAESERLSMLQISLLIWLCGVSFASIFSLFLLLKLKNGLKSAIHFERNIYFTDTTDSPFVFGLWKPKIYLPTQVTEEELSYIIAHEQEHIRRFDHFTRLICHVALILHWFNPLVWLAYYSSEKDMEQSCDEAVLKEKSLKIRGEYARTLLKFSADANFMTPLAFSESNTKGRVKNIMKMKKTKLWVSGLTGILVVVLIVGFATSQKQREIIGVLPEQVENYILSYYTKKDGVEETLVYRLRDNEEARSKLSKLLGGQAYYLLEFEDDPEKLQEMLDTDTEQIMLWGEYGDDIGSILTFDRGIGEASVLIGNNLANMHSGLGEFENRDILLHELFEFYEENKEILHQVEVLPEKPTDQNVKLVGDLKGLTYEIVDKLHLVRPMTQILAGSSFYFIGEEGNENSLSIRVYENDVSNLEELKLAGNTAEQFDYAEYKNLPKEEFVTNRFGYAESFFHESGFSTEACYLPMTSEQGEEYWYQVAVENRIGQEIESSQSLWSVEASFLYGEHEIYLNYIPDSFEQAVEMTETIFAMAKTFEIAPDALDEWDIIWSDYIYVPQ